MADKIIDLSAEEIEANLQFVSRMETGTVTITTSGGMTKSETIPFQKYHDNPTILLTVRPVGSFTFAVIAYVMDIGSTSFDISIASPSLGMNADATKLPDGKEFEVHYLIVG